MSSAKVPKKTYLMVWAALMFLLAATWGVAEFNLGIANTVVAVIIAFIKMGLVILFFMHVRYNSRLTWVFAAAGFVWFLDHGEPDDDRLSDPRPGAPGES